MVLGGKVLEAVKDRPNTNKNHIHDAKDVKGSM
jgi:hypothetical protein